MSPAGVQAVAAVVGACVGSFLNVVVWRLPRQMSLVSPGSRCPSCAHAIRWRHNLPVLGWLILRGRCYDCKAPISPRYPLVEALTAALFVLVARATDVVAQPGLAGAQAAFVASLVAISFIDWDLRLILDSLSKPMLAAGLLLSLFVPALHPDAFPSMSNRHLASLAESALAATIGALLLLGVRTLGSLLFRKEAMGLGDVKLLAMIGAYTSPIGVVYVLLIASLVGAVLGSAYHIARKRSLAPIVGTLSKGRYAFSQARVRPDRVDVLVAGAVPAAGERVDVSLVIPKDDNWFDADVHVSFEGTVESVTPHEGASIVRVVLADDVKDADADALSTFAHARVAVPFGPFLAAGGVAVVLYMHEIAHFVTETWPHFVRG